MKSNLFSLTALFALLTTLFFTSCKDETKIKSIKLDKEALLTSVESIDSLRATIDPPSWVGDIQWISADASIVKVDSIGDIVAKAKGATTITAKAGGASATCMVTVLGIPESHTGKPIDLTLEMLKSYIWDYTASPKEIKYMGDKPMIIDLYAAWCGPCKQAAPVMKELAELFKGKAYVVKAKICPDNAQQLNALGSAMIDGAQKAGMGNGIPYFLLLAPGKPATGFGFAGTADLKGRISKFFKENGAE